MINIKVLNILLKTSFAEKRKTSLSKYAVKANLNTKLNSVTSQKQN